jgi:GDPmannose 4,6-dehydratase
MKAIISGVSGQDGSYLAELLLDKGFTVIGFSRRVSVDTSERIKHLFENPKFIFEEGDICDHSYICKLLIKEKPDHFYNLAAQSHVGTSFSQPIITTDINYGGVLNVLNAIKDFSPKTRLYQASTSEMFGSSYCTKGDDKIQDENTLFLPQSPYAIAKLAAHHSVRLFRENYGLFACSGILFNHESPRRGDKFVTKKITNWLREFRTWRTSRGNEFLDLNTNDDNNIISMTEEGIPIERFPKLRLGNLDASRDWGYANDYVQAMHMMLEADKPDDFVVATGETYTVRDFLDAAFFYCSIEDWTNFVVIDPKFYRPAEVDYLKGDSSKIRNNLGWNPKIGFQQLVKMMIDEKI